MVIPDNQLSSYWLSPILSRYFGIGYRAYFENLLQLAQTELLVLNLASSSIVREGNKTLERCALTGPTPSVSLTSMRVLQAYSPARVGEVRRSCRTGVWCLSWNSAHYEKAPPAVIPVLTPCLRKSRVTSYPTPFRRPQALMMLKCVALTWY